MSQAVKFQAKGYEGNGVGNSQSSEKFNMPGFRKAQKVLPYHMAVSGITENPFSDQPESRSETWLPVLTVSEPQ